MTNVAPTVEKRVAIPVKIFVFLIIFGITVWSLPNPPPSVQSGKRQPGGSDWILYWNQKYLKSNTFLSNFMLCTGLWQSWDMFSPNPSNLNIWADEVVTFADGTTRRHQYPRIEILPIPEKYLKERYRKFFERANGNEYAYLWPTFAQRIALEEFKDPKNPPIRVELWRHFYFVKPPSQVTKEEYTNVKYFTYEVDQQKLKEQAAQ